MCKKPITCVVLIGTIPPPFGGVSIHIKRLARRLVESGIKCYIISSVNSSQTISGVKVIHAKSKYAEIFHCFKLLPKKPIYHFHTMWNSGICKFLLKLVRQRIVSTIHDTMLFDKYQACSYRRRLLNKIVIQQRHEIYIAVNADIQAIIQKLGVTSPNVFVIPAYLPETETQTKEFPEIVREYIEKHDSVILVYGWKVSFDKDGSDIYGFDMALRVYAVILKNIPDARMIILVPGGDGEGYIENLASTLNVNEKYLLYTEPIENMRKLLSLTTVYLRPSTTDGDSVLIREAMEAGVRVVASNVVQRPKGVVAVDCKIDNYVKAIVGSIYGAEEKLHEENYYSQIMKIYNNCKNRRLSHSLL